MRVAIVGATGLVGGTFLKVLEERDLGITDLLLFASSRSAGKKINFRGKERYRYSSFLCWWRY